MSKFRRWWVTNNVEISWFIIGSLITFGITDIEQGNWINALVSFFFAWLNYAFRAVR